MRGDAHCHLTSPMRKSWGRVNACRSVGNAIIRMSRGGGKWSTVGASPLSHLSRRHEFPAVIIVCLPSVAALPLVLSPQGLISRSGTCQVATGGRSHRLSVDATHVPLQWLVLPLGRHRR